MVLSLENGHSSLLSFPNGFLENKSLIKMFAAVCPPKNDHHIVPQRMSVFLPTTVLGPRLPPPRHGLPHAGKGEIALILFPSPVQYICMEGERKREETSIEPRRPSSFPLPSHIRKVQASNAYMEICPRSYISSPAFSPFSIPYFRCIFRGKNLSCANKN